MRNRVSGWLRCRVRLRGRWGVLTLEIVIINKVNVVNGTMHWISLMYRRIYVGLAGKYCVWVPST